MLRVFWKNKEALQEQIDVHLNTNNRTKLLLEQTRRQPLAQQERAQV